MNRRQDRNPNPDNKQQNRETYSRNMPRQNPNQQWTEWNFVEYAPDWTYTEAWFVPGPYAGVGPRGQQRSDEDIRDQVIHRLTQHGRLDARQIDVQVQQGEVYLKGTVNSRQQKRMAEDAADTVPGVADVHNELNIRRPQAEAGQKHQGQARKTASQPEQSQQKQGQQQKSQPGKDLQEKIKQKMEVDSSDGKFLGWVVNKREDDFQLDRHGALDLFVPYSAIQSFEKDHIVLKIPANEVNKQGWPEEKEGIKK